VRACTTFGPTDTAGTPIGNTAQPWALALSQTARYCRICAPGRGLPNNLQADRDHPDPDGLRSVCQSGVSPKVTGSPPT